MTGNPLPSLPTDELIRRYVDGIGRLGGSNHATGQPHPKSAAAQLLAQDIKAIGDELCRRKPIAALRPLYDSPDRYVRFWASVQFSPIDREWASAGVSAMGEGVTAAEVVALRRRVLALPSPRPSPQEMSNAELVTRFEDAGVRSFGARFLRNDDGQDFENRNRITDEMLDIIRELKARESLRLLLPLLDHPNKVVRISAAMHCLPLAPEQAVSILEGAKGDLYECGSAANALAAWRAEGCPRE